MKTIAITGNIGSGKTTISRIFESTGIPVFYADEEAKKLYAIPEVILKVKSLFGEHVFENNTISFKKLAELVFNDPESLKKLESVIHPLVATAFMQWAEQQKNKDCVIMENAVLFEGGFDKLFDVIIVVTCPEQIRLKRIIERDQITEEVFYQRAQFQWDEAMKISRSQFHIANDNIAPVLPQVWKILQKLNGR
jgi:dephospho-CoA kinase